MHFNKLFGLNVFKLVYFEVLGISVSEVFIMRNVKQVFSDDLFAFLEIAEYAVLPEVSDWAARRRRLTCSRNGPRRSCGPRST